MMSHLQLLAQTDCRLIRELSVAAMLANVLAVSANKPMRDPNELEEVGMY